MASSHLKIEIDDAKFRTALKQLAASSKNAALALSSLGGGMQSVAAAMKNFLQDSEAMTTYDGSVSRKEFQELAEKYARVSQRFTMLLSLISVDELKRLELLDAAITLDDVDGWDRVYVLKALDKKIADFNAAHQRLTGKRKKLEEPGRLDLNPDEVALVLQLKQQGLATWEIVDRIKRERVKHPIKF